MEPFKFNTTATEIIPLAKLENNTGQVEGLPANPRKIDHGKLEKLKQSITDNPEYLQTNPLKVFALTAEGKAGKYVIIGGNMRLKALKALGYKDVPCMVISPDTPPEKLRAYTILDNSNYGQWDWEQLTKDWNIAEAVCETVASSIGIHFYKDAVVTSSRDRLHPNFVLTQEIAEDNVVVFDDILTTGSTMKEMGRILRNKNTLFVIGICNR